MARKNRSSRSAQAAKKKAGTDNAGTGKSMNRSKKDKNVFKVADTKTKNRPREVQVKLKKMKNTIQNKREKIDKNLKQLHEDMVVKKVNPVRQAPKRNIKKAPANAKNVEAKLNEMKV